MERQQQDVAQCVIDVSSGKLLRSCYDNSESTTDTHSVIMTRGLWQQLNIHTYIVLQRNDSCYNGVARIIAYEFIFC